MKRFFFMLAEREEEPQQEPTSSWALSNIAVNQQYPKTLYLPPRPFDLGKDHQ
ncbi:hypothetical protein [Aliiroseovarius sp. 2305UL8-7]|uniref:hypothetical protein n=1 Tax=Aliiroseovarius conchicola TaxID=3121637 RepID=UPI003528222E